MENNIREFRDGIFALNTRRFGKVAELMIEKMYNFKPSSNLAYDLLSQDGKKIEVKFSTVLKKCKSKITANNVIEQITNSTLDNRMLSFNQAKTIPFDCNIQQVKIKEFDELYYGCFFEDKIMICKINSCDIIKDPNILYSDHQHRGNLGEGQFHINNLTIDNHLNKYLVQWISYKDLYDLFC